jgi:hypothetical protein
MSHPSRILGLVSAAERLNDTHAANLLPPGIALRASEMGM